MAVKEKRISLAKTIGNGYGAFWRSTKRYRVCKGSRGSKKSCTTALNHIVRMMEFWTKYGLKPHMLVVRRFYNAHKDSTFAQLKWAIKRLGVEAKWKVKHSPLELTYIPSGQKIMFRGLDNEDSITSITVDDGYLCWVWWEEAFQCQNEQTFNKIDLSIRGDMPAPLFKQHTLTFNPWSEQTWMKPRFFDKKDKNADVFTTTYHCNEFLGEDDLQIFEDMKVNNPKRYSIEGLANWGIAEGLIYQKWREDEFDAWALANEVDVYGKKKRKTLYGLDFGFANDPSGFLAIIVEEKAKKIWVFDELYLQGANNQQLYDAIVKKGYKNVKIVADSEDPRTINELLLKGLNNIVGAKKGPDSVIAGIQKLQEFELIVHPSCENFKIELYNYVWDTDKETGKLKNKPIAAFDHLLDPLRYATEEINIETFSW